MDTGKTGEILAADYYRSRGFNVLELNWRHSYYEIDLVAAGEGVLHVVEVKTRRGGSYGFPEESIDHRKLYRLMKAGVRYQQQHPQWKRIQYDVLSIRLHAGAPPEYFLIEDVYA
ncbi:putative endonuclease [Dinghuibacter silviterrae]|uniref:Putative endonuclease n=2 Tax=Dinghuibacter silviterrae TaxID=1539049 RepID=A0A4R8DG83_9BACT|nr:putative endonuclease [Dinghuibacter silviterrae]